jgi:iron complex transport system permease protein
MTARMPYSRAKLVRVVCVSLVLAIGSCVLALLVGEAHLDFSQLLNVEHESHEIFFSLRLPRVMLAALVGAALSGAGSALQSMLRNPLADPFVLGVSGGAALGATLSLALGFSALHPIFGLSLTSVFALLGAIGATLLVLSISRSSGENALLSGVIFNAFALAAIIFIKSLVAPEKLGEVLFWLAGSLGHETATALLFSGGLVFIGLLGLVILSPRLNLLSVGEEDAMTLGLNVNATRMWILILCSLSVAAAVSLAGLVGFVGLLVPHVVRLVIGADMRLVLPASIFSGAAFLMLADALARVLFQVFQSEPPVGVITALLGGPMFLFLLKRRTGEFHASIVD